MTIKEKQNMVERFVKDMAPLFQVQFHVIEIKMEDKDDDDGTTADIIYRQDYQSIHIRIYPLFWKNTKERQRKDLLHELCHSITIPMKKLLNDARNERMVTRWQEERSCEEATSRIENILDHALRGNIKEFINIYKSYLD